MELCQGYTLDLALRSADSQSITEEASTSGSRAEEGCSQGYTGPSLLGSTYLAAQVGPHRD